MSRIGKKPIAVPSGVTVTVHENEIEVKGPKGTLMSPMPQGVSFKVEEGQLVAGAPGRSGGQARPCPGAGEQLRTGVTEGFARKWTVGVGYKAGSRATSSFCTGLFAPGRLRPPQNIEAGPDVSIQDQHQSVPVDADLDRYRQAVAGPGLLRLNRLRKPTLQGQRHPLCRRVLQIETRQNGQIVVIPEFLNMEFPERGIKEYGNQ
jgi:large subunit ribosomal protein L6